MCLDEVYIRIQLLASVLEAEMSAWLFHFAKIISLLLMKVIKLKYWLKL